MKMCVFLLMNMIIGIYFEFKTLCDAEIAADVSNLQQRCFQNAVWLLRLCNEPRQTQIFHA